MTEPKFRDDEERLDVLLGRVRSKRPDGTRPHQHVEQRGSWRPAGGKRGPRRFDVSYGRDGAPRLRER